MLRVPTKLHIAPPDPSLYPCPVAVFCVRLESVMLRVPPRLYIAPPYPSLYCPCPVALFCVSVLFIMLKFPLLYIAPPLLLV